MKLITISRQLGSGGNYIATRVAEIMGLKVIDKDIFLYTTRENDSALGQDGESISDFQDKPEGYAKAVNAAIKEYAKKGNTVILGRGAHIILQGNPEVLNVRVEAPIELRAERIMQREFVSHEEALRKIALSDKQRAEYHKLMYQVDWNDSAYYDLVINTGRFALDSAVEMIVMAAQIQDIMGQNIG